MTHLAPYSGSLLRLALTTIAIFAAFAAALAVWQESAGGRRVSGMPAASSASVAK